MWFSKLPHNLYALFYYCRITNFKIMEQESEPQLRPCPFSCQVNSYIITSIDVFWSLAPPGLRLFWVYFSLFLYHCWPSIPAWQQQYGKVPAVYCLIVYLLSCKTGNTECVFHNLYEYFQYIAMWITLSCHNKDCLNSILLLNSSSCFVFFKTGPHVLKILSL